MVDITEITQLDEGYIYVNPNQSPLSRGVPMVFLWFPMVFLWLMMYKPTVYFLVVWGRLRRLTPQHDWSAVKLTRADTNPRQALLGELPVIWKYDCKIYGNIEDIWRMSGKNLENIWKTSGKYQENVCKTSGKDNPACCSTMCFPCLSRLNHAVPDSSPENSGLRVQLRSGLEGINISTYPLVRTNMAGKSPRNGGL